MVDDPPLRTRVAREAAERALVRIVRHSEFVVLGGLVPELLCSGSGFRHAGTTDIDVQVDLEVASGSVNAARLDLDPAVLAADAVLAVGEFHRGLRNHT